MNIPKTSKSVRFPLDSLGLSRDSVGFLGIPWDSLDTQVDSGKQEEVAGVHLGTLGLRGLDGGPGHDRATTESHKGC